MSSPTVPQLRALVALADTLQFGQAADQLGVAQPTVSAAIGSLEVALGAKLADRTSRKVVLTPLGREAADRARHVLAALDGFVGCASGGAAAEPSSLRLGIIPTVAPYVVAPVLRSLNRRLPELKVEVTEDQTARLVGRLLSGSLDAALLALPTDVAALAEEPLYWEDFLVLVPPGHVLAGRDDVAIGALKDMRLLLLEEGHCLTGQVLDICQQVGAAIDHPARATSLTTVAQLVAAGLGETLVPATALAVETRKGKLAVARFRPPAPGRRVGLVYVAESPKAAQLRPLAAHLRRGLDRPGFAGTVLSGPGLELALVPPLPRPRAAPTGPSGA